MKPIRARGGLGTIQTTALRTALAAAAFLASGSPAGADLKTRGFADLLASRTDSEYTLRWIGNDRTRLNYDGGTRLGLNLSADLSDRWDFAAQILARGTGGGGEPSFVLAADWLFATYRPIDSVKLRFGRQIFPLFLFSDRVDVGFTYPWTRLPWAIYGLVPSKAFAGMSASYTRGIGELEATAQVFGGAGGNQFVAPGIGGASFNDFNVKGLSLSLASDHFRLAASYKSSRPQGTIYASSPGGTQLQIPLEIGDVQNLSLGGSADLGGFMLIAEMGRGLSNQPSLTNNTGAYGTVGYHLWSGLLTPHLTYARQWNRGNNSTHPSTAIVLANGAGATLTELRQVIAGLNLRASNTIIVKAEWERDQHLFRTQTLEFTANTFTLSLDTVF